MMPTPDLVALRQTVDDIDLRLIELLAQRFDATDKIGVLKATYGLAAVDAGREQEQRQRLSALAAERGLSESLVLRIFREIVAEVVRNHERVAPGASPMRSGTARALETAAPAQSAAWRSEFPLRRSSRPTPLA